MFTATLRSHFIAKETEVLSGAGLPPDRTARTQRARTRALACQILEPVVSTLFSELGFGEPESGQQRRAPAGESLCSDDQLPAPPALQPPAASTPSFGSLSAPLHRENNFIKDFPQLADGLLVIPLPVEEQCRGVLSEPLPDLQLLTGKTHMPDLPQPLRRHTWPLPVPVSPQHIQDGPLQASSFLQDGRPKGPAPVQLLPWAVQS